MPQVPFIGGAYLSRTRRLAAQRCVNLYAERDEAESGASVGALVGTPGLRLFANIPGVGEVRGLYTSTTGRVFAVCERTFWEILPNGNVTPFGTLITSTGPISMADNGTTILIVDGTHWYTFLLAGGFTIVNDPNARPADVVTFLDGYFVLNIKGTGEFQLTPSYGVTPIDPSTIATAEGSPDSLIGLIVFRRELRLFGAISTENWFNAGGPDFPFARNPSGFIDTGCVAPFSVAQDKDAVYWLASDKRGTRQIVRSTGYEAERISTHPLASALASYAMISDARGWCYDQDDHQFYVLTFPTADRTWVYDATTGLWHERAYWNSMLGVWERWRASCYAAAYGRHLVGDKANGKVYELDLETYTDDGAPIRRIRAAAHQQAPDLNRVAYHRFLLNAEVGIGPYGTNPKVYLRYSDDGGSSWTDYIERSLGALGNIQQRVQWDRLGAGRDRVWEVSSDAPVAQRWISAHVQASGGYA